MLLDREEVFAHRSSAADALIATDREDWQTLLEQLLMEASADSVRLGLEFATSPPGLLLSDDLLVKLVISRAEIETRMGGLYFQFAKVLPNARLENFLDVFVAALPKLGNRHKRSNNNELTDLGYDLIARRLKLGPIDPVRLWRWLRPFDEETGFSRDTRRVVHEYISTDDMLRRAIQTHVLFDEPNDKPLRERAWRLTSRSPGFQPTDDDVLPLFDRLDLNEREGDRWKELVLLVRHAGTQGKSVRERAKAFIGNRPDMLAWVDRLADSRIPKRDVKQAKERRRRDGKRAIDQQEQRRSFSLHIDEMRKGEWQWLFDPARAYLKKFSDIDETCPAHERIAQWLGEELGRAAHEGFEAFLLSGEPPTAQQVADSHAESSTWHATDVIVAGIAERWRKFGATAFIDAPEDRLLTGFHLIRHTKIADYAQLASLEKAITDEIKLRGLHELAVRQWIEPQLAAHTDHVDWLYELMREHQQSTLASELAKEWLNRFPNMASVPEAELLNHLLCNGRFDTLRSLEVECRNRNLTAERQANWDAVAFVVDFDAQHERLAQIAISNGNWLWTLRDSIRGNNKRSVAVHLKPIQLAWMFATFRSVFPRTGYPSDGWSGDTNPWDASDFLLAVADRLADETSEDAAQQLTVLRDAPADGYTDALRIRAAEQVRKAVQERYQPVLLSELRAIVNDKPPTSISDLQASMLALLQVVQARIRSSPDDAWRGFYNDKGEPRDEERCRDHLLTVLGLHPEGIDLLPEGHLADDKRADIIAIRPGMRLPVEIKGQWHDEVWRAADSQLERLYAADYAAERRGIYIVLWFGCTVGDSKKPRARAIGQSRPKGPEELLHGLIESSGAAQTGRIKVVVLDLSRPVV